MNVEGGVPTRGQGDEPFSRRFVNVFFAVYFVLGLGLMAYTPPFQSADAFSHFDRAAGIASGQIIASSLNHFGGSFLPSGVINLEDGFSTLPFNPASRVTSTQYPDGWLQSWATPKVFVQYTTGGNLPFLYLPQAAGIVVGRLLSNHILVSFYLAQISNLLVFIALTRLAFARLPRRLAIPIGIFLFFPTVVSVATSVNPDSLLLALSVVFATMCWSGSRGDPNAESLIVEESRADRRRQRRCPTNLTYLLAFASLFFMSLEKPPLMVLGLLLPMADHARGIRRYVALVSVFVASVVIIFVGWASFGSHGQSGPPTGGPSTAYRQLVLTVTDPVKDIQVLWATFRYWGWLFTKQAVAGIAWLDISFPTWVYLSLVLFFLLALASAVRVGRSDLARVGWSLLVIVATYVATAFSLYILANQYAVGRIYGFQGRYLLPMLPILIIVLGLHPRETRLTSRVTAVVQEYAPIYLVCMQILFAVECAVMIRERYWLK